MKLVLVDDATDAPTTVAMTVLTDEERERLVLEVEHAVLGQLHVFTLGRLLELEAVLGKLRRDGGDGTAVGE